MSRVDVPNEITVLDSNVAEGDYPDYVATETVHKGDRRVWAGVFPPVIYEAAGTSQDLNPADPSKHSSQWVYVSVINKHKMFEPKMNLQTENLNTIEATISCGMGDRLTLSGLVGEKVTVVVRNGAEEIKRFDDVTLRNDGIIGDMLAWLFSPIKYKKQLVLIIPGYYLNLELDIKITAATDTLAKCAQVVFGKSEFIGLNNWGTDLGFIDSSIKKKDDFGATELIKRDSADEKEVEITIDTDPLGNGEEVDRVLEILNNLRATPCLWDLNNDFADITGEGRGSNNEHYRIFAFIRKARVRVRYETYSVLALKLEEFT